jgi:hypothetical protein
MAEGILGLVTVVIPFLVWAIQRKVAKIDAQAPQRHQEEVDRELANPDKRAFADRLSGLFDRTRPPTDPQ